MDGTATTYYSQQLRDGHRPRAGSAVGGSDFKRQAPLPEEDAVSFPDTYGGVVNMGSLGGDTIQLENREVAGLEIGERRRAEIEASEVEARVTLSDRVNGGAELGRFVSTAIKKNGATTM